MTDPQPVRRTLWWWLWVIYAIAWTAALLSPVSLDVRDAIVPEGFEFTAGKALHIAAYAVFAVLTSLLPSRRRTMLLIVVLHGPLTEFLQGFTGRSPALMDVLLDWSGVVLGVLCTWKRWRSA